MSCVHIFLGLDISTSQLPNKSNESELPTELSQRPDSVLLLADSHPPVATSAGTTSSTQSANLGCLCHFCGASSTIFCPECEREFCDPHIYLCPTCDADLCGSCLEAHIQSGHWDDTSTARERYSSLGAGPPS